MPPRRLEMFREGLGMYLQARKIYLQPRKIYLEARKIYLQARKIYLQAREIYLQARKMYLQARKMYSGALGIHPERPGSYLQALGGDLQPLGSYLQRRAGGFPPRGEDPRAPSRQLPTRERSFPCPTPWETKNWRTLTEGMKPRLEEVPLLKDPSRPARRRPRRRPIRDVLGEVFDLDPADDLAIRRRLLAVDELFARNCRPF